MANTAAGPILGLVGITTSDQVRYRTGTRQQPLSVLSSDAPEVVASSITILERHARLTDLLHQPPGLS